MARQYHTVGIDYGHGLALPLNGKRYLHDRPPDHVLDGLVELYGIELARADFWPWLIVEGWINREIAWRLITMLRGARVRVVDLVAGGLVTGWPSSVDDLEAADVDLVQRVRVANEWNDGNMLVDSLHVNAIGNSIAGPSLNATGASVFTSEGETPADEIATSVIEAYGREVPGIRVRAGDWSDDDPDHERPFYVLRKTNPPAVLLEAGMFVNVHDAMYLASPEGQLAVARAHFVGLMPFLVPFDDDNGRIS